MAEAENTKTLDDMSNSVQTRIERNRQKALAIRQSKLVSHPYANRLVE